MSDDAQSTPRRDSVPNRLRSWAGWAVLGVASGALAFAFELVTLTATAPSIWSSPGALAAVGMMLGSAMVVAVPFTLACRCALGINGFTAPPRETIANTVAWLRDADPERSAMRVAALGSIGVWAGLTLAISSVVIGGLGNPFARAPYNAVLHAAAAFGTSFAVAVVARALFRVVRPRLLAGIDSERAWAKPLRTPAHVTIGLIVAVLTVGVAGTVFLVSRGLTPNVVLGGVAFLLALLGGVIFVVVRPTFAPRMLGRIAPLAVLVGFAGLFFGSGTPASKGLVARTGVLTTPIVRVLRGITDFDGDGYSGLFGGGDCAPRDANVSPAMRDIIDNGIDENCNGADFTSDSVIAKVEPAFVDDHGLCEPDGCDFVLITIDSLRSDRLGAYTPGVALSPRVDAISNEGTRFDNAYCLGPGTILTVPQLFSVRHDTQLDLDWSRAREIGPRPLTEDNLLFPQVLSDNGYGTGGIAGHFYLEPLRYGFDLYENRREHWTSNQEVTSPRVTELAIDMYDQLASSSDPFFQWVHYYDPHHDYMPHEEGAEDWNDQDRYDAEVRFTDEWIGRFVDHVEANPTGRPLVWIITADHGEGLGDHGIRYHNRNFYDELCRVPLIFRVPGAEPRAITGPVSLHDIGATVLNLAGLPPQPVFEGRSLVDSIVGGAEDADRLVFHQAVYEQGGVDYEVFGVSDGSWRLFWDRLNGTVELFDAVEDRREEHNLELQLPEVRNTYLEYLEGFLRRVEP